jgi:hypothetical protein
MNSFYAFGIQVTWTFVSFLLIVKYYLWPRLVQMPRQAALRALVAAHLFRHLGLLFVLSPQIVADSVPHSWTFPIACGDMLAVTLAMIAFVGLSEETGWARAMTWLFNVIGFGDLMYAYAAGMMMGAWNFQMGPVNWCIATFLAPVFISIHVIIFKLLLIPNSR